MDSFTPNSVFFLQPKPIVISIKNALLSLTVKENAFYIATAQLKNQGNLGSHPEICLYDLPSYIVTINSFPRGWAIFSCLGNYEIIANWLQNARVQFFIQLYIVI